MLQNLWPFVRRGLHRGCGDQIGHENSDGRNRVQQLVKHLRHICQCHRDLGQQRVKISSFDPGEVWQKPTVYVVVFFVLCCVWRLAPHGEVLVFLKKVGMFWYRWTQKWWSLKWCALLFHAFRIGKTCSESRVFFWKMWRFAVGFNRVETDIGMEWDDPICIYRHMWLEHHLICPTNWTKQLRPIFIAPARCRQNTVSKYVPFYSEAMEQFTTAVSTTKSLIGAMGQKDVGQAWCWNPLNQVG